MDSITDRFLKRLKDIIEGQKDDILNNRYTDLHLFNYHKGRLDAFLEALETMRFVIKSENSGENEQEDD